MAMNISRGRFIAASNLKVGDVINFGYDDVGRPPYYSRWKEIEQVEPYIESDPGLYSQGAGTIRNGLVIWPNHESSKRTDPLGGDYSCDIYLLDSESDIISAIQMMSTRTSWSSETVYDMFKGKYKFKTYKNKFMRAIQSWILKET